MLTLPAAHNSHAANNKPATIDQNNLPEAVSNEQSDAHIEQAVEKIQETVNNLSQNLKFSIDEDTGKTVIKVMDVQTDEIIRQIPSQEAITIARTLDKVQGLLLNDKA
ncbi:MAG: flagellar protein FlaG [Nitrosomonas sp.]|nr:flagellar protein FlaG [Nitrosomonas sp.]